MSVALPQRNATLTAITGPGFSTDAELAATEGEAKWTGSADAYVSEKVVTSTAAGRLDLFTKTYVVIPGTLRPAVSLAPGDVLTYTYADQVFTRRVRDFEAHLMAGAPQTVRAYLEDL